jgi:hypothetical protein
LTSNKLQVCKSQWNISLEFHIDFRHLGWFLSDLFIVFLGDLDWHSDLQEFPFPLRHEASIFRSISPTLLYSTIKMERIDYTNSGGGHVRLPQLPLTEDFDAITTKWIDQRSVYTSHESETSTQVAPHQVVYDSLPGYDSYRPEYCGSGLSPGRIGGVVGSL